MTLRGLRKNFRGAYKLNPDHPEVLFGLGRVIFPK